MNSRTSSQSTRRWTHCFCQTDPQLLERIARRKFVEGVPTVELMRQARTEPERAAVTVVSLLHVPEEELEKLCPEHGRHCEHVLPCRQRAAKKLNGLGINIPSK
jgi:hypothetical protein